MSLALALGWAMPLVPAAHACINGRDFHPAVPAKPPAGEIARAPVPAPKFEVPPAGPVVPVLPIVPAAEREVFAAFAREFERKPDPAAEYGRELDYSVALLFLGRFEDAVRTLVALEAKHPGHYETASNLGTAYEFAGRLPEAIRWIEEGIARNPAAHEGSEWLHLAILRAKQKEAGDPDWLARHSVLELAPARSNADTVRAIDYQLRERLQFVAPRDAAVCDLFFQAAMRVAGEHAAERRRHYLRESLRFGDWRRAEVEKQLKS